MKWAVWVDRIGERRQTHDSRGEQRRGHRDLTRTLRQHREQLKDNQSHTDALQDVAPQQLIDQSVWDLARAKKVVVRHAQQIADDDQIDAATKAALDFLGACAVLLEAGQRRQVKCEARDKHKRDRHHAAEPKIVAPHAPAAGAVQEDRVQGMAIDHLKGRDESKYIDEVCAPGHGRALGLAIGLRRGRTPGV